MIDPVKKQRELELLTEGIFSKLFSKQVVHPIASTNKGLKDYVEKYKVLYKIIGHPNQNATFSASDLISMYINGEIDDSTELKQVGAKGNTFQFGRIKKYEPYRSLIQSRQIAKKSPPDHVRYSKIPVYFPFYTPSKNVKHIRVLYKSKSDIEDFIAKNPNLEKDVLVWSYEEDKQIPYINSEYRN